MRRNCPVCRQAAKPTTGRNVSGHMDSRNRDVCPMSGQPYEFTIISNHTMRGQE